MVIFKWLNSILFGSRNEVTQAAAGQYVEEIKKEKKSARSIDLINAALVDHAEDLDDLLNSGNIIRERKRLKRKVREKVESAIASEYNDPEIIEEVTERITDAAEVDPYYKTLFDRD